MSLLREIQNEATNSTGNLSNLLRKCKILAARLGNEEFKQWVNLELSGYDDVEKLPDYRIISVHCKGHFRGMFGSGINNAEIPLINIPEEHHDALSSSYMMGTVAEIESLASGDSNPQQPLPAEFLVLFGDKLYENQHCIQAWKVVPRNQLIGILDEVKNRILNFVLEIEELNPHAGDADLNSQPVSDEKVSQIFNNYFAGDVQNVATGSQHFKQKATSTDSNSELFKELIEAIHGLNKPDVTTQIINVVEEMQANQGTNKFRENYQTFTSLLADHMQILGPVVAPYLTALAALIR